MTRASNSTLNGEQVSKKKQKFQQEKTMDLQMAERHTVWFFFYITAQSTRLQFEPQQILYYSKIIKTSSPQFIK